MPLDFLQIAKERGFFHQITDEEALIALLKSSAPVSAYGGIDPTGDSLHIGHLLPFMLLYWWQQCGHRPIVLIGGATAKIGDPSGKNETRNILTQDTVEHNIKKLTLPLSKFIKFGNNPTDAILVNNADWLESLGYVKFLQDYGRHFTINRMLTFDSVKQRLERESPLSFLEFNYMIFQAYDFLELLKRHDCMVQFGGSDQWGNIVNGVDLIRRVCHRQVIGMTCPLITTANGHKMGKTATGAVWLDTQKCSAYDYWQFWRNTQDSDVGRFLRLFTTLDIKEIIRLDTLQGSEINTAKKILADEATAFVHGRESLKSIHQTVQSVFNEKDSMNVENLPSMEVSLARLHQGLSIIEVLTMLGFSISKAEAKRLIQGKGVKVNNMIIDQEDYMLTQNVGMNDMIKISVGKKRHGVVKVST